jgi:hypothetical protein
VELIFLDSGDYGLQDMGAAGDDAHPNLGAQASPEHIDLGARGQLRTA